MSETLQYFLGLGITGVLFTQLATSVRAWLERKRERDGLLRVLYEEVLHNHVVVITYSALLLLPEDDNGTDRLTEIGGAGHVRMAAQISANSVAPRMGAWEEPRVKLAQHLSSNDFASLASYYQSVARLQISSCAALPKKHLCPTM